MVIGHLYGVMSLETRDHGKLEFQENVSAQMVVLGHESASIIVTDPGDALLGVMSVAEWCEWSERKAIEGDVVLKAITYQIVSVDGKGVLKQQPYRHPFKDATWVRQDWTLMTEAKVMFKPYALNFLIDSKDHGNQRAIQFIN